MFCWFFFCVVCFGYRVLGVNINLTSCVVISPFSQLECLRPSFSLFCWFAVGVFFFSLRCWGNTKFNPLVVCVSPCVSSSWPRTMFCSSWSTRSSRQRPRLFSCVFGGWQRVSRSFCFFFFSTFELVSVFSVVVGLFPLLLCLFLTGLHCMQII